MDNLPTEIIACIDSYLSQSDYLQLLMINHVYHAKYAPMLYKNITLYSNDKLIQFAKRRQYCSYIQSLNLCRVSPEKSFIESLPKLFPSLQSLIFRIPHQHNYSGISFDQSFSQLTSLKIFTSYATFPLLSIVGATSHLRSLYLEEVSSQIRIVEMLDSIHQACPYLESLLLRGFVTFEPSEQSTKVGLPANSMKSFILEASHLGPHQLWLQYVANRYPNIESLRLQHRHIEGQPTANSYSEEFYDWFWSRCPRLVQLEWLGVIPDEAFLSKLNYQQRQLQKLIFTTDSEVVSHLLKANTLRCVYQSTILNLEIGIPQGIDHDAFLNSLSMLFPQLEHLKIYEEYARKPKVMSLRTILSVFLSLRSLELSHLLFIDNQCSDDQQPNLSKDDIFAYSLTKIVFDSCSNYDQVLEYIAPRCPKLKQIIVNRSNKSSKYLARKRLQC